MTKDEAGKYVSQAEAARLRGVTRSAIAELIRRGRLRTKTLYGTRFVYRSEVENFQRAKSAKKSVSKKAKGKK